MAPTMKERNGRNQPRIVDIVDSEDDEEIPEDEAFNSDDERRYGSFFTKKGDKSGDKSGSDSEESEEESDSEDEDGIASDDDDSEGDGGQYMLDLLNKLDSSSSNEKTDKSSAKLATNVKESEFASAVVRGTGLTLDALMEGLEDTKGFGVMQKTMKDVSQGEATSAPVSRNISNRAERKVHYQHQSQEVSQWIDAVKQNREAESLDFRPKERLQLTREELIDKFVPTTEFEKELSIALEKAGQQDEEAILKQEQALLHAEDDLGSGKLSMEEYKKRRGELAKIRALMFYHEQKRHHINKIKSKKYRRIRKKQRARQKEAETTALIEEDPDLARELEEKEEMERMKERMTLAHKNTSKWAKRVLKRGKNMDMDTRRALSAQLKRGDDLRKKMDMIGDRDDEDDDEEEDLIETARKVLADTESDSHSFQKTGLFKLSFMQKGIEKQRERAKEEARQLLRELEENEDLNDETDGSEEVEGIGEPQQRKAKVASAAEMKKVLPDGEMVAASLEFGNSNSISVSGGIDIDLSSPDKTRRPSSVSSKNTGKHSSHLSTSSRHTDTLTISNNNESNASLKEMGIDSSNRRAKASKQRKGKGVKVSPTETEINDDYNPWMVAVEDTGSDTKKKKAGKSRGVDKNGIVDVEGAVALLDNNGGDASPKQRKGDSLNNEGERNDGDEKSANIAALSQKELVRRAFAAPTESDVEEEFAKEKEEIAERDDPTRKKVDTVKTVSGWGSWAGDGVPPPRRPRKLPKRLQAPEKKLPKRKRQDEKKPHVIINEKRQKRTANNYQIAHIPYPYSSREEYERAMTGGVGAEWNVTSAVKSMTRREIYTRAGKVIQPLSKKVKVKRAPAKF